MTGPRVSILGLLLSLAMVGCGSDGKTRDIGSVPQDRAQIAFWRASGGGIYDLGIVDDRGRDLEILTGESIEGSVWPQLFTDLSWSPDGKRIVFAGGKGPQTDAHDEPTNLYVHSVDGSETKRLSDIGDATAPLWSPDGKRILVTRGGALWSVRPDGSALTRVTGPRKWDADVAGSFSADSSRFAVTRYSINPENRKTTTAVYLMNADGSHKRKLLDDARDPAFSPDGKQIAFTSDRDRNGRLCYGDQCTVAGELYLANADGTEPERLTKTNAINEAGPSWFPGGSRIAYDRGEVVDNAQGTGIFQMNTDGSCVRKILADPELDTWYANPDVRPTRERTALGPLRC